MSLRRNLQGNQILPSTLFLALKTNVYDQVVGSFAIQDETTESIKEALNVLEKWNASWNPKMFMIGNCDEEIDAIEILFPGMLN